MVDAGKVCDAFHHATVRNVPASKIQCDEIWNFVQNKNNAVWKWTAIEEDTKFMIAYKVGDRTYETARTLFDDLRSRMEGKIRIRTDRLPSYSKAIWDSFFLLASHEVTGGSMVSNAYVDRQNLNMRMGMRRYTRKTKGFSKKQDHQYYLLSLYFVFYNFIRNHLSLGDTLAMATGLVVAPRDMGWIVDMVDEAAPPPNRPKTYRKRIAC